MREATFDDELSVRKLWARNNLKEEQNSWKWLWLDNPAYEEGWPIGWVLESNGEVVGSLGNVPLRYALGGNSILAAAARGFIVSPEARSHSLKLVSCFLSQGNVDILLNTSANKAVASILKYYHCSPVPSPSYNQALYWVINSNSIFKALLKNRYALPGYVVALINRVMSPLLLLWLMVRGHGSKIKTHKWKGKVEGISIQEIGLEFDHLWNIRKAELPQTLLSDRSAATLRWRFVHSEVSNKQTIVLVARFKGQLMGYLILLREDAFNQSLSRFRVIDLFVSSDSIEIIDGLLKKAYETVLKDKVHAIEWVGFPSRVRERFMAIKPFIRELPSMPFWFCSKDPDLLSLLMKPEGWYASPYDGDASL